MTFKQLEVTRKLLLAAKSKLDKTNAVEDSLNMAMNKAREVAATATEGRKKAWESYTAIRRQAEREAFEYMSGEQPEDDIQLEMGV